MFEWLPDALSLGISECDFWRMNPHKLKPYVEAEKIRNEDKDRDMWTMGYYVHIATLSSIEKNLAGKKSSIEYLDKPLSEMAREEREELYLSEDEKMRQVEALFTSLQVLSTNSKIKKLSENTTPKERSLKCRTVT